MRELTIVGGGITGLTAAYIAAKGGRPVTLLEAAPELGGLTGSFPIAGTQLEQFYHHFFTHDVELLWLLKELKLQGSIRFYKGTMGIFKNGRSYDFSGPLDLLSFSPLDALNKLRFLASAYHLAHWADWRKGEGMPALAWLERFAGAEVTDCIWRPMMEVKFGSHAKHVPLTWLIGRLRQRLHSRRGVEERLGYLDGGLRTLNDALFSSLKTLGVRVLSSCAVRELLVSDGELKGLVTDEGSFSGGDFLATLPTTPLVKLLEPHDPGFARDLAKIRYSGAICVVLELHRPLSGVYWLNIADKGFPFGGIIEHTNLVGTEKYGAHVAYLSRYYTTDEPIAGRPLEEVKSEMAAALGRIAPGFEASWIKAAHVFRAPAASIACGLHHSKVVPACRTRIKNLYLAGMSHVYPDERSCNNAIRVAAEACRVMGIDSSFVPAGHSLSGKIGMD